MKTDFKPLNEAVRDTFKPCTHNHDPAWPMVEVNREGTPYSYLCEVTATCPECRRSEYVQSEIPTLPLEDLMEELTTKWNKAIEFDES